MARVERHVWIDCLRLLAGLSMLVLHTTADATGQPWVDYEQSQRIAPLFFRAVVYIARTELFLIISVFLLLLALDARPRSYAESIREQARRLLIPFLFWTLFYAAYGLIKADAFGYGPQARQALADPAEWVRFLLLGGVKYHMHFLPTLFWLVLLFPLFRLAVSFPALGLSVIVFLVVRRELDAFVYDTFWGSEALPYLVRAIKILTYAGYGMVAGAALGIWKSSDGAVRERWVSPILFLGGLLFLFKLIATWKTIETGQWQFDYAPAYWADFLFPVVLFSLCLALGHRRWPDGISHMARYSFGIYLCHPIFLDLCEIALQNSALSPIALVGIKSCLTLAATIVLVLALARTRPLAWTIGLGPLPSLLLFRFTKKETA